MIRQVTVDHGREVAASLRRTTYFCIACDDCKAEGPKRLGDSDNDAFALGMASAEATSAGWTHRLVKQARTTLRQDVCPTCSACSAPKTREPSGEQLPLFCT